MKKMNRIFLMLALMVAFSVHSAYAGDPIKIGFVYVTSIGDVGWTYQHDLGRRAIEKKFGDKVKVKYVENVAEGPDSERVIRKFASTGYNLIFAPSFGYMNPMFRVAKAYPKVIFEHASGYKKASNMGNYLARLYEGRYLAGVAAASKSKSKVMGYVATFPIPEVVRGINAFLLGAQSVHPEIKVKVLWTHSWYDPGKEVEVVNSLVAQGADVLTHHNGSMVTVKTANDKGVYAVGYHSNMFKYGEQAHIGAVVHRWENFYTDTVEQVVEGRWKSRSLWRGIKDGWVDFVVTTDLAEPIDSKIKALRQAIVSGKTHPFEGPVYRQNGRQVIARGEHLSDQQLLSMDYFVKGVEGNVEK